MQLSKSLQFANILFSNVEEQTRNLELAIKEAA